jgi:hypothetical protein
MRGLAGRLSLRQGHHARSHLRAERRDARWPCLVAKEPSEAFSREALLPAPDRGLGHARLTHDRVRPEPIGAQQHDASAPDMLLRRIPVSHEGFEPKAIRGGKREGEAAAHPARLAGHSPNRNPGRTQPSGFDH